MDRPRDVWNVERSALNLLINQSITDINKQFVIKRLRLLHACLAGKATGLSESLVLSEIVGETRLGFLLIIGKVAVVVTILVV